jgi:hypothetical protein
MPELPEELKARPERKAGQEPTASLTLEAYKRLRTELNELLTNGRDRMAERLKVAREHGDIKENAEYDAAKDAQGLMESQIRRLQEALRDPGRARRRESSGCPNGHDVVSSGDGADGSVEGSGGAGPSPGWELPVRRGRLRAVPGLMSEG